MVPVTGLENNLIIFKKWLYSISKYAIIYWLFKRVKAQGGKNTLK